MKKEKAYGLLEKKEGLTPEQIEREHTVWWASGGKNAPDGYPRGNPFWRAATYEVLDRRKGDIKKAEAFLKKLDESTRNYNGK